MTAEPTYADMMQAQEQRAKEQTLEPGQRVSFGPHLNSREWYHHPRWGQVGVVTLRAEPYTQWVQVDFGHGGEYVLMKYLHAQNGDSA